MDDFVARPDSEEAAEGSSSSNGSSNGSSNSSSNGSLAASSATDADSGSGSATAEPPTDPLLRSDLGSSRGSGRWGSEEQTSDLPPRPSPPTPISSAPPATTNGAPLSVPAGRSIEGARDSVTSTNGSAQQLTRGSDAYPAEAGITNGGASGSSATRRASERKQQQEGPASLSAADEESSQSLGTAGNGSAVQAMATEASDAALLELRDDFEAWQQQTVAMWQFLSGKKKSVKWLSVSCRDRSGGWVGGRAGGRVTHCLQLGG